MRQLFFQFITSINTRLELLITKARILKIECVLFAWIFSNFSKQTFETKTHTQLKKNLEHGKWECYA